MPLNASTKVDSTYLPSYVDDVIEVANFAALPVTGETGKIYITLDTNFNFELDKYLGLATYSVGTNSYATHSYDYFTDFFHQKQRFNNATRW